MRLLIAKPRLGVDHRRDQRRVEVLGGRLLADDVVVRSGRVSSRIALSTSIRLIPIAAPTPMAAAASDRQPPAAPGPGPRRRAGSACGAGPLSARGSRRPWSQRCQRRHESSQPAPRALSSEPSLVTTWVARWRPSPPGRAGGRCGPRAARCPRSPARAARVAVVRDHAHRRVESALHARSRTAAAPRRRRARCPRAATCAPVGDPHADQRVEHRLEPGELLGPLEDDRADALAVHLAVRPAPPRPSARPAASRTSGEPSSSWTTASRGQRRRAEPREGGQRLRLAGGDRAGQADESGVASGATGWSPVGVRRSGPPSADQEPSSSEGVSPGLLGLSAASAVGLGSAAPRAPRSAAPRCLGVGGGSRPRGLCRRLVGRPRLGRRLGEDLLGDVEVRHLVRRGLGCLAGRAPAASGRAAAGSGARRASR